MEFWELIHLIYENKLLPQSMGRTMGGGVLKLVGGCIATKLYVKPEQHRRGGNLA